MSKILKKKKSNRLQRPSVKLNTEIPSAKMKLVVLKRYLAEALKEHLSIGEYNKLLGQLRRGIEPTEVEASLKRRLALAKRSRHPTDVGHLDVEAFRAIYQYLEFGKKFPSAGDDHACTEAALAKFFSGETHCQETNNRFRSGELFSIHPILHRVRRIIADILCELPPKFLDKCVKFGPGSTVNLDNRSYAETSELFKLSDRLVVPNKAKLALAAHISYNELWIDGLGRFYDLNPSDEKYNNLFDYELDIFKRHIVVRNCSNKITFVPKNSQEHRSIGVEPNGLLVLQKVMGDLIRKRLKAFGLDLDTQSYNQHAARRCYFEGLCTIDMKNASNTLAYETVKALLPREWFSVLDMFRSDTGHCPYGKFSVKYEMFSSMGNGFTFELESLIFFAIALAIDEERNGFRPMYTRQLWVYGDDVILPAAHAADFVSLLAVCGFEVNLDKSFITGSFFESCGSDYYRGVDVRPFYLKREVLTVRDVYFLCNQLMQRILYQGAFCLWPLYSYVLKTSLKATALLWGPLHFQFAKNHNELTDNFISDNFETAIRVPFTVAQALGSVKFDLQLQSWSYYEHTVVAIKVPHNSYFVPEKAEVLRHLLVHRGHNDGLTFYKGRSRDRIKLKSTSSWDGNFSRETIARVSLLFDLLFTRFH